MTGSKHRGPVPRWVHAGDEGGIDAELGNAFRSLAADEAPLSDAALARVGRRLVSAGKRRAWPLFRLVPLGIAVLVGGSGAALAQWAKPGIWDTRSWFETRAVQAPSAIARAAQRARAPSQPELAPALPAPQLGAPQAPSALVQPAAPSPAAPSGAAIESELLRRALEMLRRDHDGAAALEVLDEYRVRFPAGVLTLEASVARVDALLLLGRRAEALQQLSRLPLERVGRRSELQLLRAELNAERADL